MKNAALIKAGIILAVIAVIVMGIIGHVMKHQKKISRDHNDFMETSTVRDMQDSESESEEMSRREVTEENTIDYTLQVDLPEDYPEQEPDPEAIGEITVYFTNMQQIDESNLFPLTAWEKLAIQTQRFLKINDISATEIQAVSETLKNEDDKISFEAVLPELPGSRLIITYDLGLKQFLFDLEAPASAEAVEIEPAEIEPAVEGNESEGQEES